MHLQVIRTLHPPKIYIPQLAALVTQDGTPLSAAEMRHRLSTLPQEDRLLLAIEGDLLIGYAHLRTARSLVYQETAEVASIIVRPSHRRRGVGRLLISAAETWARQSGRPRLLLRTEVIRTGAHAFYTALGYEADSTILDFVRELDATSAAEAPTITL
jgi:GNAT superfamily N-acetyltransferase